MLSTVFLTFTFRRDYKYFHQAVFNTPLIFDKIDTSKYYVPTIITGSYRTGLLLLLGLLTRLGCRMQGFQKAIFGRFICQLNSSAAVFELQKCLLHLLQKITSTS